MDRQQFHKLEIVGSNPIVGAKQYPVHWSSGHMPSKQVETGSIPVRGAKLWK